jgi:hypothetical protein
VFTLTAEIGQFILGYFSKSQVYHPKDCDRSCFREAPWWVFLCFCGLTHSRRATKREKSSTDLTLNAETGFTGCRCAQINSGNRTVYFCIFFSIAGVPP